MYTGKVLKRVYMGRGGVFNKGLLFSLTALYLDSFIFMAFLPGRKFLKRPFTGAGASADPQKLILLFFFKPLVNALLWCKFIGFIYS